jgi:hypothetical protein
MLRSNNRKKKTTKTIATSASKSYKAPARNEQFVGTGTLLAESFNLPNNRKGER